MASSPDADGAGAARTAAEERLQSEAVAIAAMAKALAHPARVKVVQMLMRRETCIGCDIVDALGLAASTTSEHLRILKAAGIVVGELERPRVCYSLDVNALAPLRAFLETVAHSSPPAIPGTVPGGRDASDAKGEPTRSPAPTT